jgi:hypothetical protein
MNQLWLLGLWRLIYKTAVYRGEWEVWRLVGEDIVIVLAQRDSDLLIIEI